MINCPEILLSRKEISSGQAYPFQRDGLNPLRIYNIKYKGSILCVKNKMLSNVGYKTINIFNHLVTDINYGVCALSSHCQPI